MLTTLENRVVTLKELVGNMKEILELVEGRTDGFDSMEEQLRDFVLHSFDANTKKMNKLVESTTKKLAERDENLEDMVLAMKKVMEELKVELMIYKATLNNGMLSSRSTDEKRGGNVIRTWEEFQRELKKQFYPQYAEKEARAKLHRLRQQGTVEEYVQTFSELMLQISDLREKEAFYWFEDGLKSWAKHELYRQGIAELTVAMAEVESFVELGPTKDKFQSSKPNGKGNGESNHEEDEEGHIDDGNSTDSTSGNGKPRDAKRGSNNPRDKGKRIKCFICQGPHMA
ncbi:hypothetical protein Godav_010069 [Gossypium davidsonii]|uniref:Retrotransposon gag domain-containing protein n=1 Tax=Gossypium davidsonii TaxID=34287 RepID=A0A7J8SFB1_GOSDV|nr:hypothetical protein [Gossypium davidsonii]